MTGRKQDQEQQLHPVPPSTMVLNLVALDIKNKAAGPVWTAEAGAIVQLVNGKRVVKMAEVVS